MYAFSSLQSVPRIQIGGEVFKLEIAETEEARSLGLGTRDSLCERCAMLFVFEKPEKHAFWMKDMRFPLDIVWLFENRVVHIERNVPADSREILRPEASADRVLEFNAGAAKDLETGERVQFFH